MKHNCILCEIEQITNTKIHDLYPYCDTCTSYYGLIQIPMKSAEPIWKLLLPDSNDYIQLSKKDLTEQHKELIVENDMLYVLQDIRTSRIQKQSANNYLTKTLKRDKEWINSFMDNSHRNEKINPFFVNKWN